MFEQSINNFVQFDEDGRLHGYPKDPLSVDFDAILIFRSDVFESICIALLGFQY